MDATQNEETLPEGSNAAKTITAEEADLLALPSSDDVVPSIETPEKPGVDTPEERGLIMEGAKPALPNDRVSLPTRPGLRRDNSAPSSAPQSLPPPAPPAPASDSTATDSLSLVQLRRLVNDMPKVEPTPYAFEYKDASTFPAELEEWFSYSVEEQAMILKCQSSFALQWTSFNLGSVGTGAAYDEGMLDWTEAEMSERVSFLRTALANIQNSDSTIRLSGLEALTYISLGCWHETAGVPVSTSSPTEKEPSKDLDGKGDAGLIFKTSASQIQWIEKNTRTIIDNNGIPTIFSAMRASCEKASDKDTVESDSSRDRQEPDRRELWCCLTLLYMVLELAHMQPNEDAAMSIRARLQDLEPDLLLTLMALISRIRWEENCPLPIPKILLLLWKAILVFFGGLEEVEKAKKSFRDPSLDRGSNSQGQPLITASPLDYHLFRQEISSKYPAYNAPPPLFPLEPENNSILPPLKNHPSKAAGSHIFGSSVNFNANGTSIFHQPVHIATPAPSPPPSPAGPGGKGGKKQNYQTNQMFPFLYPPLDESSNALGGKGATDLQDLLVGRKWDGSDIPASILEAAELFSSRMRATRAMKQLWDVRVQFMKYERGWMGPEDLDTDVEPLKLSDAERAKGTVRRTSPEPGSVQERLDAVEAFYKNALPHLQSLAMVLIKLVLNHVTTLVTQSNGPNGPNGPNGLQTGFQFQENQNGSAIPKPEPNNISEQLNGGGGSSIEEHDNIRTHEVMDKALTGILLLLLKWFKTSHILKFEYLTQLLVDSSYIPLVLKLLQLQEIERVVNYSCDRQELNFFNFCLSHSRHGQANEKANPTSTVDDSSEDDAAPPPIKRQRDSQPTQQPNKHIPPPEVDELGFPTSDLPTEPITTFSWRAFFTSINYLRILQKVCKSKAHRNLMLVSYKSSQVLRKCLRVPQPALRLYTLKLFKNQVPYCGRKWRQTNMRVITAVYLHCRPELRDDWLSGSDVDAEVDESVPLEQALRALTHWWNLRLYPEAMGAAKGVLEEEWDFFRRELEKMQWMEGGAQGEEGGMEGMGSEGLWENGMEGW